MGTTVVSPRSCQHAITDLAMTAINAIAAAFIGWAGSNSQSAGEVHVILKAGNATRHGCLRWGWRWHRSQRDSDHSNVA
jgi:hypothetical protein